MLVRNSRSLLILLAFVWTVVGCGSSSDNDAPPATNPLYGSIGTEKAYCTPVTVTATSTAITATAQYQYRPVNRTVGLTAPSTANIRYAEVLVLDSSGNTVQCGETDSSGNISLTIPRVAGTYTLKVNSRSENSNVKASILDNPTDMTPYAISSSFTLTGSEVSKAVTLPSADYLSTLEGGAFNILDQILVTNEFIRNNSTCAALGNICTAFTVAPKVRIFWTPGMSPGAYYSSPTSAISFFIANNEPTYGMAAGIYLMGGINGSLCVDTDHFDNSVIIHEYGHYLEYAFAYSDSPGGSHNGNSVIDPRLAWSEGWANFLQGAVRSEARYVDTTGNPDCTSGTGVNVDLDLENITAGQDAVSGASYLGEGIFREVSVSRALWDTMSSKVGGDSRGADVGFAYIWRVLTDATDGFKSTSIHFRNIGHFNELMRAQINTYATATNLTDFDALISTERQRSDRNEYARPLTAQAAATCTFDLQGTAGVNNLARTQDFFSYYYDGSTARATINMRYAATPSGTPTDLDLYVWNEDHALDDSATLASSSARFYPESAGSGLETISLSGKGAGYYMIQIATDPDNVNSTAQYYLETNGGTERLCP